MKFQITSLYRCGRDMDRAAGLDETFLERQATVRDEFTVFSMSAASGRDSLPAKKGQRAHLWE